MPLTPATCPDPARLDALEEKLALAEVQIDALNLTLYRQQEKLDSLQQQLRVIYARLEALPPSAGPGTAADEKPPHY